MDESSKFQVCEEGRKSTECASRQAYWAEFKKEFKNRKSLPKNLNGFKRIWFNISKYVANKCAQNLMECLKRKLDAVANGGVLKPYKLYDK
jgi:hypothetical protein